MAESDPRRPPARPSHLLADEKEANKALAELTLLDPLHAVVDATASLNSLELATSFGIGQRLKLVSSLDETVQRGLAQVLSAFLGLQAGQAQGTFPQWQALHDYWGQLGTAYGFCVEALAHNPRSGPVERLPLLIVRSMRALACQMKVDWTRYLPPQEATWAAMVGHYKTAVKLQHIASPVTAYRADTDPTTPTMELAAAVMLQAAAPLTLAPRQVELVARIASNLAASFDCSDQRGERCALYIDLERPGPPAQVPAKLPARAAPRYIGSGLAFSKLKGLLEHVKGHGPAFLQERFGPEFSAAEKIAVMEHLLRYWGDAPPSRQHTRTSLQAAIKVVVGLEAIKDVLAPAQTAGAAPQHQTLSFDGDAKPAANPAFAAATDAWKLTDFNAHGLGAALARRPEGWLRIGSPFIFRLERAQNWCLAVVRRLQTDERNQTEVGAQILSRAAAWVRLETSGAQGISGLSFDGDGQKADGAPATLPGRAVLLPADPELKNQPSLLLEPGTSAPAQVATMRLGETSQRIELGEVIERGDGFERVAFK